MPNATEWLAQLWTHVHPHVGEWGNGCSSIICHMLLRIILNLENRRVIPMKVFFFLWLFFKMSLWLIGPKLNKLLNYEWCSNRMTTDNHYLAHINNYFKPHPIFNNSFNSKIKCWHTVNSVKEFYNSFTCPQFLTALKCKTP